MSGLPSYEFEEVFGGACIEALAAEYMDRTEDKIPVDEIKNYTDEERERLIEIIADDTMKLLRVDPKIYLQARDGLISKIKLTNLLKHDNYNRFGATKDIRVKMKDLEKLVRIHKRDIMIPWIQIGIYVAAKWIRKIEGGVNDALTRQMRSYRMYEKAATAAIAYNDNDCNKCFFLNNCPQSLSCISRVPAQDEKNMSNKKRPKQSKAPTTEVEEPEPKVQGEVNFQDMHSNKAGLIGELSVFDETRPKVTRPKSRTYEVEMTITREEVEQKHKDLLGKLGSFRHTDQKGLADQINEILPEEFHVLSDDAKNKLGVWATNNNRKDLIERVSQVLDKDAETYTGFITKTDPHIMNWTCDPMYELGNHAHALALKSTDSYMYVAWTAMGWRIKKGALYQSNYIEYLESVNEKLRASSVTQMDVKGIIAEAFASNRGAVNVEGNETDAPVTREDIEKIIADGIASIQKKVEDERKEFGPLATREEIERMMKATRENTIKASGQSEPDRELYKFSHEVARLSGENKRLHEDNDRLHAENQHLRAAAKIPDVSDERELRSRKRGNNQMS